MALTHPNAIHDDHRTLAVLAELLTSRWVANANFAKSAQNRVEAPNWRKVMHVAQTAGLAPLLYAALGCQMSGMDEILQPLKAAYLHTRFHNRIQLTELADVLAVLGAARVPVIVLKGAALAPSLYRDIGLRPMSDLDILVAKDDMEATRYLLRQIDYQTHAPGHLLPSNCPVTEFKKSTAPYSRIEVHWTLFKLPHHQRHVQLEWFWNTAQPFRLMGQPALMLGPGGQLLHLCGHVTLHHLYEASTRDFAGRDLFWLHDIAELLFQCTADIEWPVVLQKAHEYDLVLSLQTAIALVTQRWPVPVPPSVREEIDAMTPSRLDRRYYAWMTSKQQFRRLLAQIWAMQGLRDRLRYTLGHLLPPPAYMLYRYKLSHPTLLPLAYLRRIWTGILLLRQ